MNQPEKRPAVTINQATPVNSNGLVAPGSCRLVAEVIAIKPDLDTDKTTPCGKVPCKATVKIKQVIALGAAFKPVVAAGQEIPVYFAFTIGPSATYFPGLVAPLPGLKVGSVFQADVINITNGNAGSAAWYQVYTYRLK